MDNKKIYILLKNIYINMDVSKLEIRIDCEFFVEIV